MKDQELNPFLFYSKQLQDLLKKCAKQKNPALWLYKNNAKTVLFMLEALTRIHQKAFDERVFAKWNKRFKKLEDLFGVIDEYKVLEKELKINKKVDRETLKYFLVNTNNYISRCNKRLNAKDWLNQKMVSFDESIKSFNVDYNQEYCDVIKDVLVDEIDAILYFALKEKYQFRDIEQVHEVRRKVRWLSIYAQAFGGLIQLKKSGKREPTEINYYTKEVLNSAYNKVHPKLKNTGIIQIDQDSFFALSWLINELGIIKDKGISIEHLTDAIYVSEKITLEQAREKALKLLGFSKTTLADLLKQAAGIIKTVLVKDKILERLIIE